MAFDNLRTRYKTANQDHVFSFWSELTSEEQKRFAEQLEKIDVERINSIFKKATSAESYPTSEPIEPLPTGASESILATPSKSVEWNKIGLQAIANGQVAVLLLAGGQGTRLGSSEPKGCYNIGLPSQSSLFQYQAERIARLQTLAEVQFGKPDGSVTIPWYVMTSGPTRDATKKFFESKNWFGLRQNIIIFEQGTLPCLTMDGKIMLETRSSVAVAPDGNGGLYAALRASLPEDKSRSVLSDLAKRGIQYVHTYCVDNCLVKVADPVFLGYCISRQADCAAKVVPKASPTESVGVVARRGDKFSVVEYSEITKEQAELRHPKTGELMFNAGNIANHFYTTAFLQSVESFESELAYHIARKKIPTIDLKTGEITKPTKPNGMKLELFVFDVFPFTNKFAVLEVARKDEFSPLKNAPNTGADDPQTSRRDLLDQHRRFLEGAGARLKEGVVIELSPRVTYAGEGLESVKGKTFTKSCLDKAITSLKELDTLL